jgi:glycosyltransferase involved in cell wall biosynthesis
MEAKILKRPIVCANFDGADEQIENGVTGAIVPLNDPKAIAEELSRLIRFPEIRDGFVQELEKWSPEDDLKEIVRHFN